MVHLRRWRGVERRVRLPLLLALILAPLLCVAVAALPLVPRPGGPRFTAQGIVKEFRAKGLRADDPQVPQYLDSFYPGRPAGRYEVVEFLPRTGGSLGGVGGLWYAHLWIMPDAAATDAAWTYVSGRPRSGFGSVYYYRYRNGNAILDYAINTGAPSTPKMDPYVAVFVALR